MPDPALLKTLVLAHLDVDSDSLRFSPVRTGKHNASFWVESKGSHFVLRIAPPDDAGFLFYERLMMRQEPALHALIGAKTTIPVAEIVAHDFSRALIDRDYLLMKALPGLPLSEAAASREMMNRSLHQVGQYLRQLHRLTADAQLGRHDYGYLGSHEPMSARQSWFEAFRVMWNLLIDDVVACGAYTLEEAASMRKLFDRLAEHFQHPVAPRLLHMDVWRQNILIDDRGNVTGLVDFDRALWGDIEIEFAVLDYCGISEPAFWQGYGQQRDQSPSALIRRQIYLLYEIQKYMPIQILRRNDPREAARYRQVSLSLASQLLEDFRT
ncbi:MAG: aminoglycoside phosphotransferase family protein [Chloroflexota bacterium]|nr:aminoglycoside phosphotransferase family protein [Chloroflexota bacterium]